MKERGHWQSNIYHIDMTGASRKEKKKNSDNKSV